MKKNKYLLKFILAMAILIYGIGFTHAAFTKSIVVNDNQFNTSVAADTDIVLNEAMVSVTGVDGAPMPAGEWVELKNTGSWSVDVNGWYLYDSEDNLGIEINSSRTDTGTTIIPGNGYLVVYRDANADFILNNAGDTIRLYNGDYTQNLIEEFSYVGSTEDLTYAKVPDGFGLWLADRTPTPGASND